MSLDDDLDTLYRNRFAAEARFRVEMWQLLYEEFFSRYIPPDGTFVELGAGYCELVNAVRAEHRVAVDLNPDAARYAQEGVRVLTTSSTDLSALADGSVRTVFASNFFEHLTRADIRTTMAEVRRVLEPAGRFLILQPNIRFCARDYWMFFDHITPLDDRSLTEALDLTGFEVTECITRFLPYTTKGRLPSSLALLRLYLRLRPAWRLLGQQSFVVARPRPRS
jgi:SAM-dependent methyltransferase